MNVKFTEDMWKNLNEYGKTLPPFSKEAERQMTRKLMQMPAEIPWLFEAYRFDLNKKIKSTDEMVEKLPRVNISEETKHAFELSFMLKKRDLEEKIDLWDHIEALALNQIEFRKDLNRLIRISKPKNNKIKEFDVLIKKISKRENSNTKFLKDNEPYIRRLKDTWDHEAKETTEI